MKTIIAGSRNISDYDLVKYAAKESAFNISEVVSGRCSDGIVTFVTEDEIKVCGVDGLGERWAQENNVNVKPFPADWKTYGRAGGPIRNGEMTVYADALILIWDGKSRGSANMRKQWKEKTNSLSFFEFIVAIK